MRDRDGATTEGPTETLQAGPTRPALFAGVPAGWRRRAVGPVAFVLGVAAGAGTVLWWQDGQDEPPKPSSGRADIHAVELVLFEAVAPPARRGGGSGTRPLYVEGALLLSGSSTSTVSSIALLGQSLDVRAPRLPLTVAPTDRFRSLRLRITVRDCDSASRWEPADRPFTIMWRDELDRTHTDRAGDFGRSTGDALVRYIDAVCADT